MRFVIAMMQHETNTFSPVPTPLARFGTDGISVPTGDAAYQAFKGTGTGIGAFLDLADDAGMARHHTVSLDCFHLRGRDIDDNIASLARPCVGSQAVEIDP